MEGEFSYEENRMTGTFTVRHNYSQADERGEGQLSFYANSNMLFKGTFVGGYSTKDSKMVVDFKGTKTYTDSRNWNSNGFE